jgi:hypothetical protein
MTRPHEKESARFAGTSRNLHRDRAHSSNATRWGPWLFSLLVAIGAIATVTINGSGGATTQVPAVIQVGSQTAYVASTTTTTIPSRSVTSSTTIIPRVQHLTTVVRPLASVTEHEDPSQGTGPGETETKSGATSSSKPLTSADN